MRKVIFMSLLSITILFSFGQTPNNQPANSNSNYNSQDDVPAPEDAVPPVQNNAPAQQQNNSPPQQNNYNNNNSNNTPPPGNYNDVSNQGNYNGPPAQVNYGAPSYQTFYDDLSPYGYWVSNPSYGYVWVPNVGPGFRPYYTNGYWVYSNAGWTWASNYGWGWAPFHYGRWMLDPVYGWMWIPGNQWAPAWVVWGQGNGYYGWAPVGPGLAPNGGYSPAEPYWNYVPAQHVNEVNVSAYAFNSYSSNRAGNVNSSNMTVISNSNTYNNSTYASGPKPAEVERYTGSKITPVSINETSKPGSPGTSAGQLNIYRPSISAASVLKSSPAKVTPVEKLKAVNNSEGTQQPDEPKASNPVKPQTEQEQNFRAHSVPQKQSATPINGNSQPKQDLSKPSSQSKPQKQNNNNNKPKPAKPQPPPHNSTPETPKRN